ncbi:MAG TPA: response regulator [Clostridiaceae bacterium]|nr:response regulator [Clostridiaceae bacterium]
MYTLLKLIIVDDDKVFLNGLIKHMNWKEMGIELVATATDGIEALRLCKIYKPEIVLTDISMPRMNGIELATQIRELIPDCQIVFISVHSDKSYLKMAIKLRAIDYIDKPVDPFELKEVLTNAVKLINQDRKNKSNGIKSYSRTIEDIILYLQNNYNQEITIEFLASQVYLTPNYLCNLFKKETGKTINQYITEIRIEKSKEMLANTYKNIEEIANEVGYNDARYFSKLFRKIVGKTPSEFRRLC